MEDVETLAGADIPQLDDLIIDTTGEQRATWAEGHRTDDVGMAVEYAKTVTGVPLPYPDGSIGATTSQQCTIRAEGDGHDPVGVPPQRRETVTSMYIPDLDDLIGGPGTGKESAIETKGNGENPTRMPDIDTGMLSSGSVPPADFSACRSCYQKLPIWAERQATDIAERLGEERTSKMRMCKAYLS